MRTGPVPFNSAYTYDHNGNRLTKTQNGSQTQSFTYDGHDKVATAAGETDGYDAAGSQTSVLLNGSTSTRVFDDEDRLTSITVPGGGTDTFTYNGLGLRVGKADSTGTFSFLCDGASPASPVLWDGYAVYTPGLSENRGGTTLYNHADLLGSLVELTDSQQQPTSAAEYDGFGSMTSSWLGQGQVPSVTPFKYGGWNGCQSDADTGLILMGHRYYDPRIGRFISQDPMGDGDNWYQYADNDPIDEDDPTGLSTPLYNNLGVGGGQDGTGQMFIGDAEGVAALDQAVEDAHGLAGFNGYWTNGVGTMINNNPDGSPYIGNAGEGHTEWVPGLNAGIACLTPYPGWHPQPTFFDRIKNFINNEQDLDKADIATALGFYGNSPNVTKRQVNTSASGGRAAAKSLFRKLSKGKKVIPDHAQDGSPRNYTKDGSVQIRMKSNGDTNVDIQGPNGKEDVHFSP